jgi:hypothetical protein
MRDFNILIILLSHNEAKEIGPNKMVDPCYPSFSRIIIFLDFLNVIMRPIYTIISNLIELKFHRAGTHFFPSLSINLIHHHLRLKEAGLKRFLFLNGIVLLKLILQEESMVAAVDQQPFLVLPTDLDALITNLAEDGPRTKGFEAGSG